MWKRLAAIAALLLTMLALALALEWSRSVFARDQLDTFLFAHDVRVETFPHHLQVLIMKRHESYSLGTHLSIGLQQYPTQPKYWQPRWTDDGAAWRVQVPLWLPEMFLIALPIWRAGAAIRKWRRHRSGRCATCGYDIRASKDRCSECGTPIPPATLADAYKASAKEDLRLVKDWDALPDQWPR